ncbi:D-tyrosyl-tRNA(Tyr) deacylase [Lacticaseibacillus casei]|jgi:D-tyrosyl-tRNA(Tyr) deacylase|uniref:D-aminoacyl-tRNA deacylase n=1 Tax=Lacticaseibacillus huelsenbergensis TaxID=3035291 RepID=A0ABY8DPV6_9LACO|nr:MULTISPECIES: D-aminoacyl-tRNA deacylase [Lacticaseibacillus]MDG3060714.1 D-aminoacyl-tRNA deacylase [Lacticaseibacillus sp. BCRC 81376]QVI37722.1 D-tyrosyl-tRNA(Tyr) deacylase [Lacticaseibacillus casei]QXG59513.1 D-tyrosyl-tRNA(Tyr) deacylase [Lacticaseibacillus casei]WFB39026.1 D-aminoacyl-tRNA deacylase [Lacticaseibacillus huelsenbergensis]WFB40729.1 D-aminoacyl-tRNA deacylase [Lacticaseibacillus huelsenbergensis]
MRAVVQRSLAAQVTIEGKTVGAIDHGFVVLLGVGPNDTQADSDYLAEKISKLRVFSDGAGKMNLALADVGGQILSISQFTLYADTRRGNRPSFTNAADPALGEQLYQAFNAKLRQLGVTVATGEFGGNMQVSLTNDGPVTILFDTEAK